MPKILMCLAAAGVAALLAMPVPAVASDRPADGLRNSDQVEVSAGRRHRRHVRRHWGPRYYARPYYRPYYYHPYAYGYYPYYRRPGPFVSIGPFGFGFGF